MFKLKQCHPLTSVDLHRFVLVQVPFENAYDVREYLQSFVPLSSKWKTEMIEIEGYPTALPVFFIDLGKSMHEGFVCTYHFKLCSVQCSLQLLPTCIESWLVREYGSKERGDGFQLRAEHFDSNDAPCEEAWQTSVWHREEEALLREEGNNAYMAGLELSSDATAVNFKGRSLHPLYANLRNRPTKASWQFYMPILSFKTHTQTQTHIQQCALEHEDAPMALACINQSYFVIIVGEKQHVRHCCIFCSYQASSHNAQASLPHDQASVHACSHTPHSQAFGRTGLVWEGTFLTYAHNLCWP
jgi:hypothetical protein